MGARPSYSAAKILPDDLIATLQTYCRGGGCWVYIPKRSPRVSTRRKALILMLKTSGYATAEIARRVDCSPRYVRKVLAQDRQQGVRDGND